MLLTLFYPFAPQAVIPAARLLAAEEGGSRAPAVPSRLRQTVENNVRHTAAMNRRGLHISTRKRHADH